MNSPCKRHIFFSFSYGSSAARRVYNRFFDVRKGGHSPSLERRGRERRDQNLTAEKSGDNLDEALGVFVHWQMGAALQNRDLGAGNALLEFLGIDDWHEAV